MNLIATYEKKTNTWRVSALSGISDRTMIALSKTLFGDEEGFVREELHRSGIQRIFSDGTLQKELGEGEVHVTNGIARLTTTWFAVEA